jgi:hypothetical protein
MIPSGMNPGMPKASHNGGSASNNNIKEVRFYYFSGIIS